MMRGKDCCKSLPSSGSVSSVDEYHSATSDIGEDEKQTSSKPKRARKSKDKNKDDCIEPTITSLLTTVKILQSKITSKDQLIQCLADQLVCLAEKGFCWNNCLTECIASYPSKRYVDFDCALLLDYLGGFVYYKPDDINDEDSKHPLNLKIIGATSYDSLLLSWTAPKDLEISGFDIYVNDELIERIRDPTVRKTLLHPIDLHEEISITICALDLCGVHILCDVICVPPVACDPPSSESLVKKHSSTEEMPEDTNEDQAITNEPEITTGDEPEITTGDEPEITTGDEPEITTGDEREITTGDEREITTGDEQVPSNGPEITTEDNQEPSDEPEITTEDNEEPSPVTEENENPSGEEQAPEPDPEETIEETFDSNG